MAAARKSKKTAADRAEDLLRKAALDYPESHEEFPWGERAIKVRGKIFAFLNRREGDGLSVTVKLPESSREVLLLPFSEPTHYGMGKYGWVTCRFDADEDPPVGMLLDWIDESYRAVAPKKLVATLPDVTSTGESAPPTRKKKTAAKKKTAKKSAAAKKVAKKKSAKKAKGAKKKSR